MINVIFIVKLTNSKNHKILTLYGIYLKFIIILCL